jgi:hypothetical protein
MWPGSERTHWVILGSRLLSGCLDDSPQTANARVRVHVRQSGSPPGRGDQHALIRQLRLRGLTPGART